MKKLIVILAVGLFAGSAFASCGAASCDLGGGCETISSASTGSSKGKVN